MNEINFDSVAGRTPPCATRPFEATAMAWIKRIVEFERDGVRYRLRPMDIGDIDRVTAFYREHCPYFHGSARQDVLEESLYVRDVAMLSRWEKDAAEKLFFGGVGELVETGELIMVFLCRRDPYDRLVQNIPVVIAPAYRGKALAKEYVSYLDTLWRESGADYVYGFVSARHIFTQRAMMKVGGKVGGLLPGLARRSEGNQDYRDAQVYMYKSYNGADRYSTDAPDWKIDELAFDDLENMNKMPATPLVKRPFKNTAIAWVKQMIDFERQGKQFRIRPMDRTDISAVVSLYRAYCPYFYRSASHYYFDETFFQEKVCFLSEWDSHSRNRLYFFGVIEDLSDGKVVMPFGTVRDAYDRFTKHLATVIDPLYRGHSLANDWMAYLDVLCANSGLDYAYGLVSLQHPVSQRVCSKVGYKAGAIFPGMIRRTYNGHTYFRDAQIYMYKFYNDAATYSTSPLDWHIDPQTQDSLQKLLMDLRNRLIQNSNASQ